MEVIPEGASLAGDPSPVREETEISPEIEVGESKSAKIRHSARKMALRSSLGHPANSRPKSPMMRMAEMRKNGLRGRALGQVGKKGHDGPESKASKRRKGFGGKGAKVMATITEFDEDRDEDLGGLGVQSCDVGAPDAVVAVTPEDRSVGDNLERGLVGFSEQGDSQLEDLGGSDGGMKEGQLSMFHADEVLGDILQGTMCDGGAQLSSTVNSVVGVGSGEGVEATMLALSKMDNALELCEAQPLQNMTFLIPKDNLEAGKSLLKDGGNKWWC